MKLVDHNFSFARIYLPLRKEMLKRRKRKTSSFATDDSVLREVRDVFESILNDQESKNSSRLSILIEGYVRKLKKKYENESN